jgi:hypothetical protein
MAQRLCVDDAELPSSRCAWRRCYRIHVATTVVSCCCKLVINRCGELSVLKTSGYARNGFKTVMRVALLLLAVHAQYCACLQCLFCSRSSSSGKALSRRAVFEQSVLGASAAVLLSASPASALIKGNAPPTAEERQRKKLAQGKLGICAVKNMRSLPSCNALSATDAASWATLWTTCDLVHLQRMK